MGTQVNDQIRAAYEAAADKQEFMRSLRDFLHEISPQSKQPIDNVRWVPYEMVQANDYNPNSVAKNEMRLLHTSISHDGYTQPVVTIWDEQIGKFVIVDGFHRYTTMRLNEDIQQMCNGMLPIVVIDKSINDRMASTVRHNRARGKHSISGMANMVFQMLENGWADDAICKELGLEADELIRLKHVTGFSKLFDDVEYRRSWETRNQIHVRVQAERLQQAAKKTSGNGGGGGVAKVADLDKQYETGAAKAPEGPSAEHIEERQRKIEGQFRENVKRANEAQVQITCPSCAHDFYIDKDQAGRWSDRKLG